MSRFSRTRNRYMINEQEKKTNFEIKLFGTSDKKTDLYKSILEIYESYMSDPEEHYKIVFTLSSDKKSISVEVSPENGIDARSASQVQGLVEQEIFNLKPEDWADMGDSFTYKFPVGVSYRGEEEMEMNESLRRFIRESIQEIPLTDPGAPMQRPGRTFHHNGPEQESDMIRSNLFIMAKKANAMHDEIANGDDLPEWVQEKIAVAGSMIDSVYDYLDYEYHKFNQPEMPPEMPMHSHGSIGYMDMPMMEGKKKNGRVVKGKYHGETYKATSAMAKAIEKGASYEELKKMAKWADNPDAVVNAAIMAVKGRPARKNEG